MPRAIATWLALIALSAGGGEAVSAPAEESATVETAVGRGVTRLQGQALFGRNRPVVGVSVAIRGEDGRGTLYLTSTDDRGTMRAIDLPDGTYRVEFRKPGLATVEKERVVVRPALRPVLEVVMVPASEPSAPASGAGVAGERAAAVRGRVVDPNGVAVPDVRLRLVRRDGRFDPRTVRTDAEGAFDFGDVPEGDWSAEVLGVGFLPIRSPIVVDAALAVTVRVVPQPADYRATALDLMPPEVPVAPAGMDGVRPGERGGAGN